MGERAPRASEKHEKRSEALTFLGSTQAGTLLRMALLGSVLLAKDVKGVVRHDPSFDLTQSPSLPDDIQFEIQDAWHESTMFQRANAPRDEALSHELYDQFIGTRTLLLNEFEEDLTPSFIAELQSYIDSPFRHQEEVCFNTDTIGQGVYGFLWIHLMTDHLLDNRQGKKSTMESITRRILLNRENTLKLFDYFWNQLDREERSVVRHQIGRINRLLFDEASLQTDLRERYDAALTGHR